MFVFLIKLTFFNFLYSFAVGLILTIVMLPMLALLKSERPGPLSYLFGILVGMPLCAIQGIMIAAAVVVALQLDPARWDPIWYILGFVFSAPIALVRSQGDPEQSAFSGLGILSSNIAYILACILPQYIPPFLGSTAVKLLL